jgi:DNA-binding response OmpR family regulator
MRLLLVEDDERVAAALSAVLAKHGFGVVHACNGEEALRALLPDTGPPFSVVLLDLGLPGQDGFDVCGRIRRLARTPVIMVTARSDVQSRIHGLNLGADDYIVKPYDIGELLARIHAVGRRTALNDNNPATGQSRANGANGANRGGDASVHHAVGAIPPYAPGNALCLGPITIALSTRQIAVDGTPVSLTRKEFDLLALLAGCPGIVFRREQIISEVWRTSWEGTGRTLEVHVASLRSKLGLPALIETVRGVGYRLVVPTAR